MVHEFRRSNISLRASALTFSIILSMVPLLAMSTAILKGLGNGDQMRIAAYRFIDQLDPESEEKQEPAAPASLEKIDEPTIRQTIRQAGTTASAEAVDGGQAEQEPPLSLNLHLHNAIDTIFDYVENTNFAALGAWPCSSCFLSLSTSPWQVTRFLNPPK
jgi:membrane protein